MLPSRVEVQRVCLRLEEGGGGVHLCPPKDREGVAQYYFSLSAPSGVEVSACTALQQAAIPGDVLRVPCATSTDLMDMVFAVQEEHKGSDDDEEKKAGASSDPARDDVTLRCQLWCRGDERREKSGAALGSSSETFSLSDLSACFRNEAPDIARVAEGDGNDDDRRSSEGERAVVTSAVASATWHLIAEGSVNATQYGLQAVELVECTSAKKHMEVLASAVFFVKPRLQLMNSGEPPFVWPQKQIESPTPLHLVAYECVDPVTQLDEPSAEAAQLAVVVDASLPPKTAVSIASEPQDVRISQLPQLRETDDSFGGVEGGGNARWMLFVEMERWRRGRTSCEVDGAEDTEGCGAGREAGGGGLWRLTLNGADGRVLACGSSFSGSLCCRCGWSDTLIAVGDGILSASVVSLQLQAVLEPLPSPPPLLSPLSADDHLQSHGTFTRTGDGESFGNGFRWESVAASRLLPISELLASTANESMHSVALYAKVDDSVTAFHVPFTTGRKSIRAHTCLSRLPTVVGRDDVMEWRWMAVWTRTARDRHSSVHPSRETRDKSGSLILHGKPKGDAAVANKKYSVVLHVTVAVLEWLESHVDIGTKYPLLALAVSGGCEVVLRAANEVKNNRENGGELLRAPVMCLDTHIHATLDDTHPVLLLTLQSPMAPEVVFGRAIFSLSSWTPLLMQRGWFPLHGGGDGVPEDGVRCDSRVVGWVHCVYKCMCATKCLGAASTVDTANRELLQLLHRKQLGPPLSLPTPLSLYKYLPSQTLANIPRWNKLQVCIVEVADLRETQRGGTFCVKVCLLPPNAITSPSRVAPHMASTASFTESAIFFKDSHQSFSCSFDIAPETRHLVLTVFESLNGEMSFDETSCRGVVELPRVVNSHFWTTLRGEVWVPLVVSRQGVSFYTGALLLRWFFSSVDDLGNDELRGIDTSLRATWLSPLRAELYSSSWLQFCCVQLEWPWLLHHAVWATPLSFLPFSYHRAHSCLFVRFTAGYFTHEMMIVPSDADGFLFSTHEMACLPMIMTDRIEVAVCCCYEKKQSSFPLDDGKTLKAANSSVIVIGVGELLLSDDDRAELAKFDQVRHVVVRIEPCGETPCCWVPFGMLVAQVFTARISRQCETRWTWPPHHRPTIVELRFGRLMMLQQHHHFSSSRAASSLSPLRWIVSVREKKRLDRAGPNSRCCLPESSLGYIVHSTVVLHGTSSALSCTSDACLYLQWPAPPPGLGSQQRPQLPTIELLISQEATPNVTASEPMVVDNGGTQLEAIFLGTVTLDLSCCFSEEAGKELYPLHCLSPLSGVAKRDDSVLGYMELEYTHNFIEGEMKNDSHSIESGIDGGADEGKPDKELLHLTVVGARYRQRKEHADSAEERGKEFLTSFLVGVGQVTWRTNVQAGMTPKFGCRMVFEVPSKAVGANKQKKDVVFEVRLQMLHEISFDSGDTTALEVISSPLISHGVAFLQLRDEDLDSVDSTTSSRWISLFAVDAQMGGLSVVVGEVLLRYGRSACSIWDHVTPLLVRIAPKVRKGLDGEASIMTETGDGGEYRDGEDSLPTFPLYLSVQIRDLEVLDASVFERAKAGEVEEGLFVTLCIEEMPESAEATTSSCFPVEEGSQKRTDAVLYGGVVGHDARYGDCTAKAVFDLDTHRYNWMEHCLFPIHLMEKGFRLLRIELRHAKKPGIVVGSGCLSGCDMIEHVVYAVPIVAQGDAYHRPFGVLTMVMTRTPLYLDSLTVITRRSRALLTGTSTVGNENLVCSSMNEREESGYQMENGDFSQLVLMRLSVDNVEIFGQQLTPNDRDWEMTLRHEAVWLNGKASQWMRLDADDEYGWCCIVCVQNTSKMEICVRRVKVDGHATSKYGVSTRSMGMDPGLMQRVFGHFVVNSSPVEDQMPTSTVEVELMNWYTSSEACEGVWLPVGHLRMAQHILMRSNVFFDAQKIFFHRVLRIEVEELIGVVRGVHRPHKRYCHSRRWSRRQRCKRVGTETPCGRGGGDALLYLRVQYGTAVAESSPFSPPFLDTTAQVDTTTTVSNSNNNTNTSIIRRASVCRFGINAPRPLVTVEERCQESTGDTAEVHLSLCMRQARVGSAQDNVVQELPTDKLFGAGIVRVPVREPSSEEDVSADVTALWVPVSGTDRARTAYARVRYLWSYRASMGLWLVCGQLRSVGNNSMLHCPFLRFVMRLPCGVACSLLLEIFNSTSLLSDPSHCTMLAVSRQVVWSFSFTQLPTIWPMGPRLESIELYDRVADGLTVHLGTHKCMADDALLFASHEAWADGRSGGGDSDASSPPLTSPGHWLSFRCEGRGEHAVLLAQSLRPPTRRDVKEPLYVPFYWWPLEVNLKLAIPGLDVMGIDAARVEVSCSLCMGWWESDGWEETNASGDMYKDSAAVNVASTTSEVFASQIAVGPSAGEVVATWAPRADDFEAFTHNLSVDKLCDGSGRYAVRARIACRVLHNVGSTLLPNGMASATTPSLLSSSSSSAAKKRMESELYAKMLTYTTFFVVDDRCNSMRGETVLGLSNRSRGIGGDAQDDTAAGCFLTLAWAIGHDRMTLAAPGPKECHAVSSHDMFLESEERREKCQGVGDVRQTSLPLPTWIVVGVEVSDVPVVQEPRTGTCVAPSDGRISLGVSVLAHLVALRRRHRGASPARSHKVEYGTVQYLPSHAIANHTTTLRPSLCSVQFKPEWRIEPPQWMDHRRLLHLTLWQVISNEEGITYPLGSLRLDRILRDAFVQLPVGSGVAVPEEVVTEWKHLQRVDASHANNALVRLRCRPIMTPKPAGDSMDDLRMPVCVEVLHVTARFNENAVSSIIDSRLGLMFFPAGNRCFSFGSTTHLRTEATSPTCITGGDAAASGSGGGSAKHDDDGREFLPAYKLVALSPSHSLMLNGQQSDVDAHSDDSFGIDVYLVECRDVGCPQVEGTNFGRGDIARVLAVERLDLRSIPHKLLRESSYSRHVEPPLSYGASDFTVMLFHELEVVTVRLHAITLPALLPQTSGELDQELPGPSFSPQIFCASNGVVDDSAPGDGVACVVGSTVYKIGNDVREWDARGAQCLYSSSSSSSSPPATGALAFHAIPRTYFRWFLVDAKLVPSLRCVRRIGHTVWACDDGCIMIEGGLCMGRVAPAVPTPPKGRELRHTRCRRRRLLSGEPSSEKVPLVCDVSSTILCYNVKGHSWSLMQTEGKEAIGKCGDDEVRTQRMFHSAVVIRDRVWCFGGCMVVAERHRSGLEDVDTTTAEASLNYALAFKSLLLNELTCLHLSSRQWCIVRPAVLRDLWIRTGRSDASPTPTVIEAPPPLACHTAVTWMEKMFVFGGLREVSGTQGEALVPSDVLYVFHTNRLEWHSFSPSLPSEIGIVSDESNRNRRNWPCARYGHASAAVPDHPHGALLIFGGATCLGAPSAATCSPCALDELLWVYYAAVDNWRSIHTSASVPLTRRVFSSMQIVRLAESPMPLYALVITGGCDPGCLEGILPPSSSLLPLQQKDQEEREEEWQQLPASCAVMMMTSVVSAILITPSLGTVWISLEERDN